MMGGANGTVTSIQMLRAIAALMVVAFHTLGLNVPGAADARSVAWLRNGVDIFFVISGFVMWISTSGRRVSPIAFYLARIRRIVPLYWLVTGFIVTIAVLAPALLRSLRVDWLHTLASLLFIPMPSPIPGAENQMWPVIIVGWTLNMEMFFYLLFGAMLLVPKRQRAFLAVAAFVGIGAASLVVTPESRMLAFYVSYGAAEFGFGVALGVLCQSRWQIADGRTATGLTLAGFALLAGGNILLPAGSALNCALLIASGLVVAGFIGLDRSGTLRPSGLWARLGDASYAIYLTHPIVVSAVGQAAKRLGLLGTVAGGLAATIATLLIAAAIGVLVHRFVERPIALFLSRKPDPLVHPALAYVGTTPHVVG
jgi:peptidoglycan/LPS O-acetylase OafA/YrhL